MARMAMFNGLVYDENDSLVEVAFVGGEAHYVVDDMGFRRHVDAEQVDRQVLAIFMEQLQDNQGMAVEQAMKMMGKDDIFTKAALDSSIRNLDIEDIIGQQIPSQARDMMAMFGFRIIINYRGELIRFDQPAAPDDDY